MIYLQNSILLLICFDNVGKWYANELNTSFEKLRLHENFILGFRQTSIIVNTITKMNLKLILQRFHGRKLYLLYIGIQFVLQYRN